MAESRCEVKNCALEANEQRNVFAADSPEGQKGGRENAE